MQELIVALIVACAAGFLTVRYVPKAILGAAGNAVVRKARNAGWTGLASRVEKALQGMRGSACGGCSGCESDDKLPRNSITVEALRRTARR